jgi:hypothetical protein
MPLASTLRSGNFVETIRSEPIEEMPLASTLRSGNFVETIRSEPIEEMPVASTLRSGSFKVTTLPVASLPVRSQSSEWTGETGDEGAGRKNLDKTGSWQGYLASVMFLWGVVIVGFLRLLQMEKRVAKKRKEMALKNKDNRNTPDSAERASQEGSGLASVPYDFPGGTSVHSTFDQQGPERDFPDAAQLEASRFPPAPPLAPAAVPLPQLRPLEPVVTLDNDGFMILSEGSDP